MLFGQHLCDLLQGGSLAVKDDRHFTIVEVGVCQVDTIDILQDSPNPVRGAGSLATWNGQPDLGSVVRYAQV
jgi:hypothetical protein